MRAEPLVERMLPLYEGKMGHQYDHRFARFVGILDTDIVSITDHSAMSLTQPRYWLSEEVTHGRLGRRKWGCMTAFLGHRRVARNTDERTSIATVLPWGAASYGWIVTAGPSAQELLLLCATYNSFGFDYCLRNATSQPSIPQVVSEQLPALIPAIYDREAPWETGIHLSHWVSIRVEELVYTAWDMQPFAQDLGDEGPPFVWDDDRRSLLRAELDAAYFHLYGIERDDVDYILDTFPIVRRKDESQHGEYRTKRLVLEVYDAMAAAIAGGPRYQTILDPPPGEGPRHQPTSK